MLHAPKRRFALGFTAIASLLGLSLSLALDAPAQEGAANTGRLFLVHFLNREKGFGLADLGGNRTNVVRTANGGKTWTPAWRFTGDFTFNDIFFVSTRRGFVTTDGRLMETTDAGESWGRIQMPFNFDLRKIRFANSMRGWVLALPPLRPNVGPNVLYTVDGGQHWMPDTLLSGSAADFCFGDTTHGWLIDDDGIQATTDGGRRWTRKHAVEGLRAVACFGADRAWALAVRQVVHTTDAGATWATHAIGGSGQNDFTTIVFGSATNGWVYNEQELRATEDAGVTWSDRSAAAGPPTFLDGSAGHALDGNGGLHWTSDGGRTWSQ